MTKIIIFIALMMGLAPSGLAVWLFYQLGFRGITVIPDKYNVMEFWFAVVILSILLTALIAHLRNMFSK